MKKITALFLALLMSILTACGEIPVEDYATNVGYEQEIGNTQEKQEFDEKKENIKVCVLHISDPAEGGGYTYTGVRAAAKRL